MCAWIAEHSAGILADAGYDEGEIRRLIADGVIRVTEADQAGAGPPDAVKTLAGSAGQADAQRFARPPASQPVPMANCATV